jgi:hypothetical protein
VGRLLLPMLFLMRKCFQTAVKTMLCSYVSLNSEQDANIGASAFWLSFDIDKPMTQPDCERPLPEESKSYQNWGLAGQINSATGTRTRVARVRAEYPNQLDYSGDASVEASTCVCASLYLCRSLLLQHLDTAAPSWHWRISDNDFQATAN